MGQRVSREEMRMQMVNVLSKRSTCQRAQVAALIVKDNRIISEGYNGPVSGDDCNTCLGKGCYKSVHAEMNAIAFAAKNGISVKGATLYCSYSPCINCAKVIVNSGIKEVVYELEYRDLTAIDFLESAGVEVIEFEVRR